LQALKLMDFAEGRIWELLRTPCKRTAENLFTPTLSE
jgi:hypothetical protein